MSDAPQREEAVFEAAVQLQGAARTAYLAKVCAGDSALRERINSLLEALERAGGLLNQPAVLRGEVTGARPGDQIGPYRLLEQIGEGGCGVVYMAEQTQPLRRRLALKILKLGMDTQQVIARFEAERQALALMDHPNIAKVLDAGATDTGRPYFVMELVRGVRLTDYCDQNEVPMGQRLELFVHVCQAIQHAHQKGVIHRDIKPSNILVTVNDGVPIPKVIDFGIAKATTGQQRLTEKTFFTAFQQFIGTPAYMSPEQALMTSLDIDTRTDIYSLGVLLYELLTSKTPLDTKDLLQAGLDEMRRTIGEKEPARPSTRLSTMVKDELTTAAKRRHTEPPELLHLVRGDLDWIVMKALEKDRKRRYETASALAMDIQRHLADEPVVASPPSRGYRLRKLVRRNRVAFAAATGVAAALVAGAALSMWQALRATRAEQAQSRLFQESLEARAQEATQRQAAEAARENEAQQRQLVQAAYSLLAEALSGAGVSNRFSPDGTKLLTVTEEGSVRLWDTQTGKPLANPLQDTGVIIAASFSQEGDRVITLSKAGSVRIWDSDTGSPLKGPPYPPYPIEALQRRQEGTVGLMVTIDADGNPTSIVVKQSSGHPTLDSNAVRTVRKWVFPAGKPATHEIPISYRLQ